MEKRRRRERSSSSTEKKESKYKVPPAVTTMTKAPKLYPNKPKKDQIKQSPQQNSKPKNFSSPLSSSSASASSTMATQHASSPPPPPPPPKESFARRYKFIWPLLLTVNLAVGAYLFMRTKKKDTNIEEEVATAVTVKSSPVSTTVVTAPVTKETLPSPPVMQPVKPLEPIPETRQRELFKWILEEKRKANPKDAEEKKRIDEEKAILKHFIRAKFIPTI